MDMTSFSRIKEMAYLKLSVHCKKCGGDFEINEETSEPVESWSEKAAAPIAQAREERYNW